MVPCSMALQPSQLPRCTVVWPCSPSSQHGTLKNGPVALPATKVPCSMPLQAYQPSQSPQCPKVWPCSLPRSLPVTTVLCSMALQPSQLPWCPEVWPCSPSSHHGALKNGPLVLPATKVPCSMTLQPYQASQSSQCHVVWPCSPPVV